jgi:hypothetical protein
VYNLLSLSAADSDAADPASVFSSVSEYLFSNLKPSTNYTVQLTALSLEGLKSDAAFINCVTTGILRQFLVTLRQVMYMGQTRNKTRVIRSPQNKLFIILLRPKGRTILCNTAEKRSTLLYI